jgi:hypothetical protein
MTVACSLYPNTSDLFYVASVEPLTEKELELLV